MTDQSQRPDHLDDLRATLKRIPNEPGVYRFLDADGTVLYVGKAKALRKRVANYLRPAATPHGRTGEMLSQAADIDWVVTGSESEALLLEDNFIKEERPPYNLRLRDDKSYPSIEITLNDEWPRVRFFRGRRVPGNLYFGPFSSARKVRDTLELIGRIFPYRKCRGPQPGRPSGSPCLQYFIKRSLGPVRRPLHARGVPGRREPGDRLPARPPRRGREGHRARDGRPPPRRRSSRRRRSCATVSPRCATSTSASRRASTSARRST